MAYIDDATRLSQPMGNYKTWANKLFYWSGPYFGWRFLRDLP